MKLTLSLVLFCGSVFADSAAMQQKADAQSTKEYHTLVANVKKAQAALNVYVEAKKRDCDSRSQNLTMDGMGDLTCVAKPQPAPQLPSQPQTVPQPQPVPGK
jgi:hypothetical protein